MTLPPDRNVVLMAPVLADISPKYHRGQAAFWLIDADGREGARIIASPAQLRYWADLLEIAIGADRLAS